MGKLCLYYILLKFLILNFSRNTFVPLHQLIFIVYTATVSLNFAACFDNIGVTITPRHEGFKKTRTIEIWTSAYVFRHRACSKEKETTVKRCENMDAVTWLGDFTDVERRRQRFNIIVQRILCYLHERYLTCEPPDNIIYLHSKEMSKMSEMTLMGIIEESPGSDDGCLQV